LKALKLLQTKPAELTNSVPGHHHSKELGLFRPLSPAQGSAQDTSLERLREQVGLISKQKCQELTLSFEPRFLVGLRIQLHGRSDIFVTQNALYRTDARARIQPRRDPLSSDSAGASGAKDRARARAHQRDRSGFRLCSVMLHFRKTCDLSPGIVSETSRKL
jgi:hypothetical protein